jgi:hypothetical protein
MHDGHPRASLEISRKNFRRPLRPAKPQPAPRHTRPENQQPATPERLALTEQPAQVKLGSRAKQETEIRPDRDHDGHHQREKERHPLLSGPAR